MSCIPWEVGNCFKLLGGEEELAVKELNSCNSIRKETPCLVTQEIDVLVAGPPIQTTSACELR